VLVALIALKTKTAATGAVARNAKVPAKLLLTAPTMIAAITAAPSLSPRVRIVLCSDPQTVGELEYSISTGHFVSIGTSG
jgi:hypothetical protein